MSTINDGGPAFPVQDASKWQAHGMALRDYFAAKAMPMVAAEFYSHGVVLTGGTVPELCAKASYEFADAMLKARQ